MAEERVQRRLAAILAADVVGYSRMMSLDETGTLSRLKKLRQEVFTPKTKQYGGRTFKTTGDGAFVEFKSAVDAVESATDIQEAIATLNAEASEDQRILLRIGISLGDVIVEGNDLYGNGVNVASRLEGLAEPGGICVSGNVHEHIGRSLDVNFEDLGEQSVKNIDQPVRCYRVNLEPFAQQVDSPPPLPDKPSIAVLPFENMSGDPEQEYFSDGITEDIITDLSKISGLFVIARNSSFSYKGESTDVRRVARELGVRNVLEGSVRRAGSQVRINAQLIDAVSGGHLWAERYDGDLENIFSLQDEIAGKIVSALEVTLTEDEREREQNVYVPNWEAYDCFIKGRYIVTENYFRFSQHSGEPPSEANLLSARRQFERAIEKDPKFAGGYAGLSWVYALGVRHGLSNSPDNDRDKAVELAEQAVDTEEYFGWSHTALASARLVQRNHDEAILSAKRAIELQPSDSDGYAYLGLSLICDGDPQDALVPLQEALRLDPLYQLRTLAFLGIAHFGLRRFDEAVKELETVNVSYSIHFTLCFTCSAYSRLERTKDAEETVQRLLSLYPGFTVDRFRRLWPYKNPTDTEFVCRDLAAAGLPDDTDKQDEPLPLPNKPSIAVLPFDNLSGDAEQEYFADGIAEDIITALSRFNWFFVIARNSSFSYKGASPDIRDVARDLGVQYVLEGSVRKAGGRVRVTAQLIDAGTGRHVWADRYDRDLEDIFAVQDEITEAITAAVAPTFASAEAQRAEHKAPESFDAWDYAIRGNWHFWRLSLEDNVEAKRLFEAAIALDSKSSLALCGLTLACVYDVVFFGDADDVPASRTRAIETAEKAISADEHDAWAHVALSYASTFNGRHDIAFSAIQRAIDLNPNLPFAEALLAQRYAWNGDYDAAHSHADTAARLSPRDPANVWWLFPRAVAAFVVEKYDEQVAWAKKATEAAPEFPGGWAHLAVGEAYLGNIENARAAMRQMLRVAPRATIKLYATAIPARRPEDLERVVEGLRKAGMPE